MKSLEKIFPIETASCHCDPLPGRAGPTWIYLFYCITTSNEPGSLGKWSPGLSKLGSFSIEDIDTIYNIVNIIIGDPYLSLSL